MRISIGCVLLCFLFTPLLWAAEQENSYDRVSLSVSAGREVENDTLVAVLYAQQEGSKPAILSREVNRRIGSAVDQAKRNSAIRVQTLDYTTSPVYRNKNLSGWRVRQSIQLESRDAPALSQLIGELQAHLGISSVRYTVSPERRKAMEDRLIAQALAAFRQRAELIAKEMARSGYRLVRMEVRSDSPGKPYPRQMRSMALQAEAAPPTLEAGTRRLEVGISGTIELHP